MKDHFHISCVALFLLFLLGCQPKLNEQVISNQNYQSDWNSLSQYNVPTWWQDAKFGIYFHWGPYSVPAHKTEWYSHYMYQEDHPIRRHHESTYGPLSEFGYKDFIPMFTAEKFNANEWAELFKKAGAKFAGPVAEHADGFAMWDSELTDWNAQKMGPKRDIVGEMEKAVRAMDMKFILTYHRHWLYAWYSTWDRNTDAANPEYAGIYGPEVPEGTFVMANTPTDPLPDEEFNREWLERLNELMDKYQPDVIWFDNKMDIIDEQYRKEFLANYYNKAHQWGREVVCTYKSEDLPVGTAVLDLERSRMSEKKEFPWLTDDSIDWGAWCHVSDPNYKSTNRLIDFLVDVVSKNGALLLNITPKANGEIPAEVKTRLLEMGEWLAINGEAIYETRPWKIFGEGPQQIVEGHLSENQNPDAGAKDIRYTRKGNALYAFVMDWPGKQAIIPALGRDSELYEGEISSVELLGSKQVLNWQREKGGLTIQLPDTKPCEHVFVFKIERL